MMNAQPRVVSQLFVFVVTNFMFITWLQLFQKEKIRIKLQLLEHSHNLHPSRSKSQLTSISVALAGFLYLFLFFDLIAFKMIPSFPSHPITSSIITTTTTTIALGACFALSFYTLLQFLHVTYHNFSLHVSLIAVSFCAYHVFFLSCCIVALESLSVHVSTFQLLHYTVLLLSLLTTSYRAFFPKLPDIGKWLTKVLIENKLITSQTAIVGFKGELLTGGCHSSVTRLILQYNTDSAAVAAAAANSPSTTSGGSLKKNNTGKTNSTNGHNHNEALNTNNNATYSNNTTVAAVAAAAAAAPGSALVKSLVVKLLYSNAPFYKKILHYLKYQLSLNDTHALSLKSYQIESSFYSVHSVKGLKIPRVYYNHADCVNGCFVMIEQDLSGMVDAQPDGFGLDDALLCLTRLAKFHAFNWGTQKQILGWNVAAYWTEQKECKKQGIAAAWAKAMKNYPPLALERSQDMVKLGKRIEKKYGWVTKNLRKVLKVAQRRTICHGDYKISNIFIDKEEDVKDINIINNNGSTLHNDNTIHNHHHHHHHHHHCNSNVPAASDTNVVYAIDWQWYGFGNCAIDVVPFICTSLKEEVFPHVLSLQRAYHAALVAHGVTNYTWEQFLKDYRLFMLEFGVFCIISKWSVMTTKDMDEYEAIRKDGLHLRRLSHMRFIMEQLNDVLRMWEKEKKEKDKKV